MVQGLAPSGCSYLAGKPPISIFVHSSTTTIGLTRLGLAWPSNSICCE